MKRNWTKADCKRLHKGSPGCLRRWIRDYADILYTWVLYHYPINSSEAKERIVRIFHGAYSQLNEYDPAASSMYAWLISRADALYPREMQGSPVPEWSAGERIDPKDLHALVLIGSQELPDHLLENPVVVQLIQAALTEMDEPERLVLLRRYHRIDRKPAVGLDQEIFPDLTGDQLVRARYYFRRHLLAWIYSFQPQTSDLATDSRTAILNKNLEKIFCSIDPLLKLPEDSHEELNTALLHQVEQMQRLTQAAGSRFAWKSVWAAAAAGAAVLAAVGAVAYCIFRGQPAPVATSSPGQSAAKIRTEPLAEETFKKEMTPEELEAYLTRVFDAGSDGDMEVLLKALEEGPFPAQIAAAIYLGRIGDESAINPLGKAAHRWYPDAQEENPFLTAIGQIEQRLSRQKELEETEREQEMPVDTAEQRSPLVAEPLQTEPNLKEMKPSAQPTAVEVNEGSLEESSQRDPMEPNLIEQEDTLSEIQDSNDIDTEWFEDEMSTGEI